MIVSKVVENFGKTIGVILIFCSSFKIFVVVGDSVDFISLMTSSLFCYNLGVTTLLLKNNADPELPPEGGFMSSSLSLVLVDGTLSLVYFGRRLFFRIKMHAGIYYHSKNMWQPDVGDIQVHFSYAGKGGDLVSVVGRQSGREIRPYATESGEELLFLYPGARKPEEVFNF